MSKFILTVTLAMFATYPVMGQDNLDTYESEDTFAEDILSPTTREDLDTTLTEDPGVLEEQTGSDPLDGTVDSSSGTTMDDHSSNSEQYYFPPSEEQEIEGIQSGATQEATDAPFTESRAVAPRGIDGRGSWNITAGPALTIGLDSDTVLYGVSGGYTFNLTPSLGARIFADANFGTGDDASQFLDIGAAAKVGVGNMIGQQTSRAYLLGDVALANAENADSNDTETGIAVGVGAGYTVLRTQRTDIDVLLRYALMLNEVEGDVPSLLTARVGVNF